MEIRDVIELIGLLVLLPAAFWKVYAGLDAKMDKQVTTLDLQLDAHIERMRDKVHALANAVQTADNSLHKEISAVDSRVSRIEGKLNGKFPRAS